MVQARRTVLICAGVLVTVGFLAGDELAAAEPEAPAGPPLEYAEELPHGEPGFLLPEEERTLSCVGIDADTGSCIGD